jgi:PadR family transcriptional regulator, regulatory protein PadR
MDRELRRGTLELVLLRLLAGKQRYGYEMTAELERRSGGVYELKEGTLYPVLYRLEKGGLVEAHWEMQERGVPRKYYRITVAGRAEMERQAEEWAAFVAVMSALLGEGASQ